MIFVGWFTDDNTFLNKVTSDTPITSNMNLYACYRDAATLTETDEQTYASVSDVSPNYSVTVLSSTPMSAEAVKEAISLELKNEDEDEFAGISVTADGGGSYTVAAAATEGFTPGCSYTLTLTDDALTFDGYGSKVRTYNITIADPDPVLNLQLNNSVKMIPASDISGITQNGEAVDSIFAPLIEIGEEDEEDDAVDEIYGTFTYNGSQELSLGDNLAIYDGTAPEERIAGMDYSDDNIAYVTVTGVSGATISYTNAEATEVLFTPDILPVSLTADIDGDETNLSITVLIEDMTYSGEDFAAMGLDSSTVVEVGDYIAFYTGTLPSNALFSGYARITHVMSDDLVYVITYVPVSEDELYESMDMAASRTLTYEELSESSNIGLLEYEIERQVTRVALQAKPQIS